jgi:hypothetical protein
MNIRWKWGALGGGLVAVVAVVAWIMFADTPPGPLAELVGEGPTRQLLDPMRPPGGGPHVLVLALDGVGHGELMQVLRSGAAPRLGAVLGMGADGSMAHGWAVPDVLSILPSTTVAAWTSVFTGEPPARSGVPGNEWFVRETRRFLAPAPVSVEGLKDLLEMYTDDALGDAIAVPTVFERAGVRSFVALSQVHRGADLLVLPDLGLAGELAAALVAGVASGEDVEREAYGRLDAGTADRLLDVFEEHGIPDLQVVYFPGIDLYTHVAEDAIPDQHRYMAEVLDDAAGAILDAYRAAGALDRTFVVIVSDHGHTPVLDDDAHALATDDERDPPALLERTGFRVRPFRLELDDDEEDYQAVLAYQGAMAYVYLADRSRCPAAGDRCDWNRPPRLEEDVLAVVRAFDAANRTGALVPELRGTLDIIFAREPRPVGTDALPFRAWDGEQLVALGDYLAANPRPDLLDLERRMEGLAAGPYGHRAGDVLLLARSGTERPIEQRFYFSAKYRSWHGSPTAVDSRIPLVVSHAGRTSEELETLVRRAIGDAPTQLDVTRLILALLRE